MLEIQQTSDRTHKLFKRTVLKGWPKGKESTPVEEHTYLHVRDELSVQDGTLFTGEPDVLY